MGLHGKQPGLLVAVILPVLLSTIVVVVRSTRKTLRLPPYISKSGAVAAESLLILSVVSLPYAYAPSSRELPVKSFRSRAP
jgi:hypothetical protein